MNQEDQDLLSLKLEITESEVDIEDNIDFPDINLELNPIALVQNPILITDDGFEIIIQPGTPLNFTFVPFSANSSIIDNRNRNRINAFLAPVAQFLNDNPGWAITIHVGTGLPAGLQINRNGGINNGNTTLLLWQRGLA